MENQEQKQQDHPLIEQKESIKIIKNTKGYNWEIKIHSDLLTNFDIERLEKIERQLQNKFIELKGGNEIKK